MSYLYGLQCMFYQLLVGLIQTSEKSCIRLSSQGDQFIYCQPSCLRTVCQYDPYGS